LILRAHWCFSVRSWINAMRVNAEMKDATINISVPLSMQPTHYLLDRAAELRAMALTATTQPVADALIRLAERFERRGAMRAWATVDAPPRD
jgi:hypothetical protein